MSEILKNGNYFDLFRTKITFLGKEITIFITYDLL
jgi:hypothetical protein